MSKKTMRRFGLIVMLLSWFGFLGMAQKVGLVMSGGGA